MNSRFTEQSQLYTNVNRLARVWNNQKPFVSHFAAMELVRREEEEEREETSEAEEEMPMDLSVRARERQWAEVGEFASRLRSRRISMGYTQGDVGLALGKMHGTDFSQTTISRFEAMNLSFRNMCSLKPLLKKWLGEAERENMSASGAVPSRMPSAAAALGNSSPRRKRTSIHPRQREELERMYQVGVQFRTRVRVLCLYVYLEVCLIWQQLS